MTSRASASRYARALLEVVVRENGNPEQVEQDLAAFVTLATQTPDLERAFASPAVPASAKRAIVEQLVTRSAPAAPLAKLLLLLADRERLGLLSDLLASYRERLLEHRRIVRAEITTAVPVPADRLASFEERLGQATGRKVALTTRVDPTLIGGAVTRVGSVVYDGSIATQLARIRERLEERS